jgi:hypothetical protein
MRTSRWVGRVSLSGFVLAALWGCGQASAPPGRAVASIEESAGAIIARAAADEPAAQQPVSFRFPDDASGAILAKVLPPGNTRPAEAATGPKRAKPPAAVESPSAPLPAGPVMIARLPSPRKSSQLKPRLVLEEALLNAGADPLVPQIIALAAAERTRVESVDVNKPIGLPYLGQPVADRAPLDDATKAASGAAAVASPMPQRRNPVPFQRSTLPDPYEYRRPVSSEGLPAETGSPATSSPKPPQP